MSDVFTEIQSLGVANIAASKGCTVTDKGFYPCPACGAKTRHTKREDPRPACIIIKQGNGWLCLQCDSKGDSVDLLARFLNDGKRPTSAVEWRAVLRGWKEGVATSPLPYPRTPLSGAARGLPARPEYGAVMALWNRGSLDPPEKALSWLASKFPKYTVDQIKQCGIVRFLPRKDNPSWWPWNHSYMAMLAFDHRGLVQSIHGRITGEPEPGKPKSRFPLGYSASGLVLANKTGVGWLRGKIKIDNVVVAEGLTSTLAVSMAMLKLGRLNFGVFGYTSGSQSCIKEMPWTGQHVYVLTDNDKTGNSYAEKIEACLPPSVHVRRGTL